MTFPRRIAPRFAVIFLALLIACSPNGGLGAPFSANPSPTAPPSITPTPFQPAPPTPTSTPRPLNIWVSPAVPDALRYEINDLGIPLVFEPDDAALRLDVGNSQSTWIYALVAPFPTVTDGVTLIGLQSAWVGTAPEPFAGSPLLMAESTQKALTALWGEPGAGAVRTVPPDDLLDTAWAEMPSWAVIPFESIEPRWKVLTIDGQSPVRKNFDPDAYPLVARFDLTCTEPCPLSPLPPLTATNRDPSKLTTLMMTGVTALVRATAYTMEVKGITYPGRDIGDWLREADITHISNEIPFDPACPPPNPNKKDLQFCSDPRYIELLEDVGTDVVELTGNHFQDRGSAATLYTLEMYNERGWPYYGGGADLEDARKPVIVEHNGNKLAFIGCNPVGPTFAWAREDDWPGAAPCDYKYMTEQIRQLRAAGYLPIATFQYHEYYSPEPRPWQQRDFRLLADAGAVIVSGSQAHFAQAKEFYNGAFIDYGLGNLFFDQMDIPVEGTRREFLDRHIFYDGRYLGVEFLTAMLEDYSRPQPMTPQQRSDFLTFIFEASGWITVEPTPTPTASLTLTPMTLPAPFTTLTPSP
ncbi:MAG: CapA family protein [Chloroflexi bacterium]|nr:CapA family protein [Chloroflexota bacterium]